MAAKCITCVGFSFSNKAFVAAESLKSKKYQDFKGLI